MPQLEVKNHASLTREVLPCLREAIIINAYVIGWHKLAEASWHHWSTQADQNAQLFPKHLCHLVLVNNIHIDFLFTSSQSSIETAYVTGSPIQPESSLHTAPVNNQRSSCAYCHA